MVLQLREEAPREVSTEISLRRIRIGGREQLKGRNMYRSTQKGREGAQDPELNIGRRARQTTNCDSLGAVGLF